MNSYAYTSINPCSLKDARCPYYTPLNLIFHLNIWLARQAEFYCIPAKDFALMSDIYGFF